MRCFVALLMIAFGIGGGRVSSSPECSEGQLRVTIRIHDYTRLPAELLSHAGDIVTRLYENIGVRTEWFGVVRFGEPRDHESRAERPQPPLAQLTINVLTSEMATRAGVAPTTLGFAAVASTGMGRIAYVIHDRVRSTAADAPINESELLGFVMAHEIGHLLLPRGPQPHTGVMKGRWRVDDFRNLDVLTLGFSSRQASQIRQTIERETFPIVQTAKTCGQP
jgi:hypothetical protein